MSAYIFNGKQFAEKKEEDLKLRVDNLKAKGKVPHLAAILVGDDPASKLYVSLKQKAAERVGIKVTLLQLVEVDQNAIIGAIQEFNKDVSIDGVLLQLPLPGELDDKNVVESIVKNIDKNKDVDGLKPDSPYISATVKGVLTVINESQCENFLDKNLSNVKICVIGYTGEIGSRLVNILEKDCENILKINSKTENPQDLARQADLIVSAVGRPGLVTKDWIKPGAVVIDVGSPKGDVSEEVREVASFITPVPGGIGPMTVVSLIENTVEAAEKSIS